MLYKPIPPMESSQMITIGANMNAVLSTLVFARQIDQPTQCTKGELQNLDRTQIACEAQQDQLMK